MVTTSVSVWKVGALAVTRVALGVGVGLLIADHVEPAQRRAVGGALATVGGLSTIPLVWTFVQGIDRSADQPA